MSKERSSGSKRLTVKKGIGCNYCINNKMHTDGMAFKCTKCKKFQ